MANGGIIGPVNDPTSTTVVTSFTASGTFNYPNQATPGQVDYLVVAGGGSGGPGGGGPASTAGTTNTGGGGGSDYGSISNAGNGGSGVVLVKQPSFARASGVWSLQCAYNFKKQGNWTG